MKRALLMIVLSFFPRMLAAQPIDVSALVGEQWYGMYLNGHKSGYTKNAIVKADDGTVSVIEDSQFKLSMGSIRQDMRVYSNRVYARDGNLARIEYKVHDANGESVFEGTVQGDTFSLKTSVGGSQKVVQLPKPKETLSDALKQFELARPGAKVGDRITYSQFEPMKGSDIHGTSEIEGIEDRVFDGIPTKVFRIKNTMDLMNLTSVSYVTEKGITLEDVTANMITMRLEPKEVAQNVKYDNDVLVSNAALVSKPIDDPHNRATLKLRMHGPLQAAHLFNDDRQLLARKGDGFDFLSKRISLQGFTTAKLPITDEKVKPFEKPSTFVQSDDPRIVAKSKEIVGGEKDAFKISSKLCEWVYKNVRSTYSARLTNASEVITSMEGDCTEHSILFIALARAAGVPAREVAGLFYVQGAQPGFYFHQWAKVWIGKWVDVDPTWNQPLADVTHIKLAEGDLFEQAQLIPIIGQIKIDVVEDSTPGAHS